MSRSSARSPAPSPPALRARPAGAARRARFTGPGVFEIVARRYNVAVTATPEPAMPDPLALLLELSRDLGQAQRQLAILAEGNTSCRLDSDTFLIKSSGASLSTLSAA